MTGQYLPLRAFFILSFFLQIQAASGQPAKDSIYDWIDRHSTQFVADSLYAIHFSYDDEDPLFTIRFANRFLLKTRLEGNAKGTGLAYTMLANAHTYHSPLELVLRYRDSAITVFEQLRAPGTRLMEAYKYKAATQAALGNTKSMDEYYKKAVSACRQLKNDSLLTDLLLVAVMDYRRSADYSNAIQLLNEVKELAEQNKFYLYYATIQIELSDLFRYSGNDSLGYRYAEKSFEYVKKYNNGLRQANILSKVYGVFLKANRQDILAEIGAIYDSLAASQQQKIVALRNTFYANWYLQQQQPGKSLELYLKVIPLKRNDQWGTTLAYLYLGAGRCYLQLKNNLAALTYLDSAYTIAEAKKYKQVLAELLPALSEANKAAGNEAKALLFANQYIDLSRELSGTQNSIRLAIMQTQYDLQNREQTIELLRKDNELSRLQLNQYRQVRIFIVAGVLLLLGFTGFLYYSLRKSRQQNQLLHEQKSAIEEQGYQLMQQALAISRYKTQMNPHFIFNAINSVQQMALKNNKAALISYLQEFNQLMRLTLDNSDKEMIVLEQELKYLRKYLGFEMTRLDNSFTFTISVEENIDRENVLIPPMLVQPVVENAVKHAVSGVENGSISIRLSRKNESGQEVLVVTVADNGPGLKPLTKDIHSGVTHISKGLFITRQRIGDLLKKHHITHEGFSMTAKQAPDTGVIAVITIPFLEEF